MLKKRIAVLAVLLTVAASAGPWRANAAAQSERVTPGAAGSAQLCIARVQARDDTLGRTRNHRPESGSIAVAAREYADALDALDYTGCPPEFAKAFRAHARAWRNTVPVLTRFGSLRGEMHALFTRIKAHPKGGELKALEGAIWSTWSEVEQAAAVVQGSSPAATLGAGDPLPIPEAWNTLYLVQLEAGHRSFDNAEEQERILGAHIQYQLRLQRDGLSIAGGGVAASERETVGFTLLRVTTLEEAQHLAETDPAVAAGMFRATVHVWYVPCGRL